MPPQVRKELELKTETRLKTYKNWNESLMNNDIDYLIVFDKETPSKEPLENKLEAICHEALHIGR